MDDASTPFGWIWYISFPFLFAPIPLILDRSSSSSIIVFDMKRWCPSHWTHQDTWKCILFHEPGKLVVVNALLIYSWKLCKLFPLKANGQMNLLPSIRISDQEKVIKLTNFCKIHCNSALLQIQYDIICQTTNRAGKGRRGWS